MAKKKRSKLKAAKQASIGLTALVVILAIALVAIPYFFKDEIFAMVKQEINKQLNAEVFIDDFDLSLIRDFPNLQAKLDKVVVIGMGNFAGDTLANIGSFELSFDVKKVFAGEYVISSLSIDKPYLNLVILEDGNNSFDVMKKSSQQAKEVENTTEAYQLSLNDYRITDGRIVFDDRMGGIYAYLSDLDHNGTGDFTADLFTLDTKTTIESLTYKQDGVALINKAKLDLDMLLEMDQVNQKYTLRDNKLQLNDLGLNLDGFVQLIDTSAIDMDLKFSTVETSFKSLLSMIPGAYTKDFDGVKASGQLELEGFATGRLQGESYPAFGIHLKVDEGSFQYPDLPTAVTNIFMDLIVKNEGGDLDNTIVDLMKLNMKLGAEPVLVKALVSTPISDPNVDVTVKGTVDLARLTSYMPLGDDVELRGGLVADLKAKTRLSYIEQERYANIYANGKFDLSDVYYKDATMSDALAVKQLSANFTSTGQPTNAPEGQNYNMNASIAGKGIVYNDPSLPAPANISSVSLKVSPAIATLENLDLTIGDSDLSISGNVKNVLALALTDDAPVAGDLTVRSKRFNANEWISGEEEPEATETEESSDVTVPDNVDLKLNLQIQELLYEDLTLSNVNGSAVVANEAAELQGLSANLLGGNAKLSGSYATPGGSEPKVAFKYNVNNIDAKQAFGAFNTVEQLAPIANKLSGTFNSNMDMTGTMNELLDLDLKTLLANGIVDLQNAKLSDIKVLTMLADKFKLEQFRTLDLNRVMTVFEIIDGRVEVEPFDMKVQDLAMNIFGSHGLDNTMDYTMLIDIPREKLGGASDYVGGLLDNAKIPGLSSSNMPAMLSFNVGIAGDMDDPKITIKPATGSMAQSLKDQAKAEAQQAAAEAKAKLKAEADKRKAAAEKQARDAANKAKADAERRAREEAAKAKKKAEEAARKAKEEAKNKAKDVFNGWKKPK